jgi:hypothetical protein
MMNRNIVLVQRCGDGVLEFDLLSPVHCSGMFIHHESKVKLPIVVHHELGAVTPQLEVHDGAKAVSGKQYDGVSGRPYQLQAATW